MSAYNLLDQVEEDALHKSRLLNVEEKPFKRITKRLLAPNSLISAFPVLPPTPPPDGMAVDEAAAALETERQEQLNQRRQFREDVILDFAAFESSIARIQFLLTSNERERERYAAEKLKIQADAQAVRDNTAELRVQLEEAQKTLALRKSYDELAEKITSNKLLKPRDDQKANIDKLHAEIAELEKESKEYAQTWAERREQFGRIVDEGMRLRRLIRDEKEEAERREGMEEGHDVEDGEGSRGRASGAETPRPDDGGMTPMHPSQDGGSTPGGLMVEKLKAPRTASPLRSGSIAPEEPDKKEQASEDTNMEDEGEVQESDTGEQEGESERDQEDTIRVGDQMDTS